MTWTCPTCGTVWPERPNDESVLGCPECGTFPKEAIMDDLKDGKDRKEDDEDELEESDPRHLSEEVTVAPTKKKEGKDAGE